MMYSLSSTLPTEEQIISKWKGEVIKPLVSVRCITFNHASYIEDALRGFLIQKTDFPFEVLIHDDASTDGSQDIIKRYQDQYPNIIKVIFQEENQYSKGNMPSKFLDPVCSGSYYADCEGDDWWVSATKLQRQVELMEARPDIDLVFSKAHKVCDLTNEVVGELGFRSSNDVESYDLNDLLRQGLASIPTASVLIRAKVLKEDKYKSFLEEYRSSFTVKFLASISGGALYMNECLCCYRVNVPGSHSERVKENTQLKLKFFKRVNDALDILNDFSNRSFDRGVTDFKRRRLLTVLSDKALSSSQVKLVTKDSKGLLTNFEQFFFFSKLANFYFCRKVFLRIIYKCETRKFYHC